MIPAMALPALMTWKAEAREIGQCVQASLKAFGAGLIPDLSQPASAQN